MQRLRRFFALSVLLGLLTTVMVWLASVAIAATLIVVPGTRTVWNPNEDVVFSPSAGSFDEKVASLADRHIVTKYDMAIWPATGLNSPTLGDSVAAGVVALERDIKTTDGKKVIFGTSQGAVVASLVKAKLTNDPDAPPADELVFIMLGNPMRPNGGFLARFSGKIPIMDVPFYGPTVDNQFEGYDIARQYDGWADFPTYPLNLIATANALMGTIFLHPDNYDLNMDVNDPRNIVWVDGNTTYITRYTENMPLLEPLRMLGLNPLADALNEPVRFLVELGYDRSVSPGTPVKAQLFPTKLPTVAVPDSDDETVESPEPSRPSKDSYRREDRRTAYDNVVVASTESQNDEPADETTSSEEEPSESTADESDSETKKQRLHRTQRQSMNSSESDDRKASAVSSDNDDNAESRSSTRKKHDEANDTKDRDRSYARSDRKDASDKSASRSRDKDEAKSAA